ncbi:MAG: hypothetical protein N7Q72_07575, partial [Spiroplasma sp. Tabriz.8]|nr:hypothetical protein [Spiroplasma sp. Tabriz.8]
QQLLYPLYNCLQEIEQYQLLRIEINIKHNNIFTYIYIYIYCMRFYYSRIELTNFQFQLAS